MGRVLITGGASGFGQALATRYASQGHRVLVTDLAHDAPDDVVYRPLDVRDDEAWTAAVRWIEGNWGGLDLLVNNAGVAAGGRVDAIPIDDWEWLLDTNLMGVVKGCRAFTPMFKAQRSGRIVNVASMAGLVHPPGMSSYNAAKAAVVALSETMLHELAPYGVGVSVVCASFFRTNLDQSMRGSDPDLEASARKLITDARYDATTIAARAAKAIDAGRFLILTHPEGRALYQLKRLSPAAYHRMMTKVGARLVNREQRARRERP